MAGVAEPLPPGTADPGGPVSGRVFKIERGPGGEKLAYVRMFSGTIRTRDRLRFSASQKAAVARARSPRSACSSAAPPTSGRSVSAGHIARLRGLDEIQIGDNRASRIPRAAPSRSSLRRRWNRS